LSMVHFTKEICMFIHPLDSKSQGLSSSSNDKLVIRNFKLVRITR
jgi:hypothetical protein